MYSINKYDDVLQDELVVGPDALLRSVLGHYDVGVVVHGVLLAHIVLVVVWVPIQLAIIVSVLQE